MQDNLKDKALEIHHRLCAQYGCPVPYFHNLDPLSELISSSLSHRTRNHDSGVAFKTLRAALPTWEAVRDAPVADVERLIAAATWPEQKAPRIQAILRMITAERSDLSLEFLADLPATEARAWLQRLSGVGPKTSAATLLFSRLRVAALPVDSHHYRVAQRTGLIGPKVSEAKAHDILAAHLPPDWDAQQVYDNHEVLMFHGQRCCFGSRPPACARCVLLDLCPEGQRRVATGAVAGPIADQADAGYNAESGPVAQPDRASVS